MHKKNYQLIMCAFLLAGPFLYNFNLNLQSDVDRKSDVIYLSNQTSTTVHQLDDLNQKSPILTHEQQGIIYLPIVTKSPLPRGIFGAVTYDGVPASNILLQLRFYDGMSWSTIATRSTNSSGEYSFIGMPSLQPGQLYYVLFLNDYGYTQWLYYWQTREIDIYDGFSDVNIGNFDIEELRLSEPPQIREISLPVTFMWYPRSDFLLNQEQPESYGLHLYDWWFETPSFDTGPLTDAYTYTLDILPDGFRFNYWYAWDVRIYTPDGGSGVSYDVHEILFLDSFGEINTFSPLLFRKFPITRE